MHRSLRSITVDRGAHPHLYYIFIYTGIICDYFLPVNPLSAFYHDIDCHCKVWRREITKLSVLNCKSLQYSFRDVSLFTNCVDAVSLHKSWLWCAISVSILLNLDYICIENPESLEKERFEYTYIRQNIVHAFRKKEAGRVNYTVVYLYK